MGLFLDLVLLTIRSGQGSCEGATVKADFASLALGTCRCPRFKFLEVSAASDHVAVGDEVGLFHVSSFLFLSDKSIIAWNGHQQRDNIYLHTFHTFTGAPVHQCQEHMK